MEYHLFSSNKLNCDFAKKLFGILDHSWKLFLFCAWKDQQIDYRTYFGKDFFWKLYILVKITQTYYIFGYDNLFQSKNIQNFWSDTFISLVFGKLSLKKVYQFILGCKAGISNC